MTLKCDCGNEQFYANQVLHIDIVVDEDEEFIRNVDNDTSAGGVVPAIFSVGKPSGPYVCTECSAIIEEENK